MILPFLLVILDLACWWLFGTVAAWNEPLLTLTTFGFAVLVAVWAVAELYELAMSGRRVEGE